MLADLAMRWILDHEAVTTVIPGATKVSQAEGNVQASSIPSIPAGVHRTLRELYEKEVKQHIRGPY
jgi:aryl-alcohol dehydrogenase-like predicted oxidoreductase